MSEAERLIARAHARADRRARATTRVDYDALNRMVRRQRAALTRAVKSGEPEQVVLACRDAVAEWNRSMWPDDWSRWQRALDDLLAPHQQVSLADLAD